MTKPVLITHEDLPSRHVTPRPVTVWLPPSYEAEPERRYPVLYMHDGQNVFFGEHSGSGADWGMIDALSSLYEAKAVAEVIVVGVWNTANRWGEYLPQRPFAMANDEQQRLTKFREFMDGPPHSDAYLRFLVKEVKPFIDEQYRTRPKRENTVVMGSSMGGLISLYAVCEYPDTFAAAGCVSTHWPAVGGVMLPYLEQYLPAPGRHKLYFDHGTKTLDQHYEPHQRQVDALLRLKEYGEGVDFVTRRFDGDKHSEIAWRRRVNIPLRFLLAE